MKFKAIILISVLFTSLLPSFSAQAMYILTTCYNTWSKVGDGYWAYQGMVCTSSYKGTDVGRYEADKDRRVWSEDEYWADGLLVPRSVFEADTEKAKQDCLNSSETISWKCNSGVTTGVLTVGTYVCDKLFGWYKLGCVAAAVGGEVGGSYYCLREKQDRDEDCRSKYTP